MQDTKYLLVAEVADRYRESEWTIRDRARRGVLPHLKPVGQKRLLFREDWLDAHDAGAELEREVIRRRGQSPGRIVRPIGLRKAAATL